MKHEDFSGVVSLYEGEREIETFCAGYADIANQRAQDIRTVFGMASGSKVFTAVVILQLIERGVFGLDSLVGGLVGDDRIHVAITIRHLLTHTSGVPDYFDEETMDDYEKLWRTTPSYRMRRPEDFFPLFLGQPQKFEPGSRFSYSNSGFVLLAHLLEQVTGRSFPDCVREGVFDRCGMERTGYHRLDMPPPNAATGYIAEGEGLRSNVYSIPAVGGGDGGCFSNGADMNRFWRALAAGRLLRPTIVEEMLSAQIQDPGEDGERYGFGVWISAADDRVPFVQGFDPGVRFLSYFDRRSGRSLTICANVECPLGPILREYLPQLK